MHRQIACITSICMRCKTGLMCQNFQMHNSLPNIESIKVETILPDSDAISCILHNFTILVGRILKKRMPFFARFASDLEDHITHIHYKEMCKKSKVVRLTYDAHACTLVCLYA